jgi:hypothetical protein
MKILVACLTPAAVCLLLYGCSCSNSDGGETDADADHDAVTDVDGIDDAADAPDAVEDLPADPDAANDADAAFDLDADGGPDADAHDLIEEEADEISTFIVVTFNTGTNDGLAHNSDGDDYGFDEAALSNEYYGNGLAWVPAVEAVTAWFEALQPDVVVFQEIFYSGECPGIPPAAHEGFVCETWTAGDPTVVQVLLGSGYQVACHPGNSDKCLAVKKSFGTIRQCPDPDFCLEGLDGEPVEDCGGGARVARATIDLAAGGEITVVNVHGTSGVLPEDAACRVAQVEQVFVDMDGEPGANGDRNVVMGDLNTDPGRIPGWLDSSVRAWNEYVGGSQPFQWVSPIGSSAIPTYTGGLNIDHVTSDTFTGGCYAPGATPGYDPVYPNVFFDHKPLVCMIGEL